VLKFIFYIYTKLFSPIVERSIVFLNNMGVFLYFLRDVAIRVIGFSPNYKEIFLQIYHVGIKSVFVVSITGLFVGALVSMNLQMQLAIFGAEKFMGGLNVSSSFRELTPLLISFIIAGKVGAYTTAELGSMKISDEIDTLRSLAIDPVRYLIVPRFIGVLISSFSLLLFGLFMSFIGGLSAAVSLGINPVQYILTIPAIVSPCSLVYGIAKCFVFGLIVSSIACFMGYRAHGGSRGLAKTMRITAETLIVSLIFFDYIMAVLMNFVSGLL